MTLTADSKGRIACRQLFPPRASFQAIKEADGRITFTRLRPESVKRELVKPVRKNGLLILPFKPGELDQEQLVRQIREERERDDAHVLG